MKEYANITCGILTPFDMTPVEKGGLIFELWSRHPWALPTHFGNVEPVRRRWTGVPDATIHWLDPFLWKNNISKVSGSVWFGRNQKHSCLYLNLKYTNALSKHDDWVRFLTDACGVLKADIGYVHLTTSREMADPDIPYDCTYAVDRGLNTHDLRKGIPNLCWAMVFGGKYHDVVERMHQISVASVRRINECQTYLQLTPSMENVIDDYKAFNDIRLKVRRELGDDFFSCSGDITRKPMFIFGLEL